MKLRFFALDSEQKQILPGAFVRTYLAADDGKPETPERQITLGSARTDHAGYGCIDLDRLFGERESVFERLLAASAAGGTLGWFIEVAGCPEFRINLLDALGVDRKPDGVKPDGREPSASSIPDAQGTAQGVAKILQSLVELSSPVLLKADDKAEIGPVGHVSDPDATDYKFSPDSFVSRRGAKTGDDGCEHLTPATLPLRQYPIYHVAIHDNGGENRAKDLPSVNGVPRKDRRILWGQILEFEQSWSSLGHSLGEVKYSLALAPGEAVKIAVIDWKRDDSGSRAASNSAKDALLHDQTVDRDIEDIVSGRVSERQSGESFMAGLAGAADFAMPQIGLSAAGRHSIGFGMSNTQGNRDMSSEAHQDVHLRTLQRSNLARSQNSSVVVQATQAESNYLSTRIVANMNRGHSLTVLYYEVLRHLAVRTEFRRADTAILVPVDMFSFDAALARRFRAQLEPVLLDSKYTAGFDALELLAAGHVPDSSSTDDDTPVVTQPTTPGPSPVATQFEIRLTTGWRWSSLLNRYNLPADTAGSIEVVAELQDGSRVKLVDLPARPPVFEQFHDMNNWAARWPEWSFIIEENGGRMIAIRRLANQAVDLRTVKRVLVRWKRVQPIGGEFDGWNLKKLVIRATAGDGASYQLVDHAYTLDAGRHELFPPTTSNDFIDNTQAPLRALNFDAPAPTPAPAPARTNSGSNTAQQSNELAEQAMLLINHLNANQYYYNAHAWLLMDSRERRLRLADYVGPLLAGMSDAPLVMSGNHLAFRYSATDLPAAAREVLPASTTVLKPREAIVTLPTRGIFAEAHLGHCNAAEKRDITRLWNFDELPVSLLPNIDTLTAGPRGTATNLTPDSMGASPLDIQGTPALPAPGEAIAQALELLAKPDIFRDQSTREQVAEIMGKLIESAQPPKMSGDNIGSAIFGGGNGAKGLGGSAKPSGTASDPSEWANPFPDRSLEISDGQSLLAEKYKNYSLLDQYDAFKAAPEMSEALDKAGIPKETKTELISGMVKGTTAKVQKTAQAKPPASRRVAVGLRSRSTFTAGVERALNGNITLEFSEPGSLRSMMPFSLLVPVNGGTGNQYATLVPSQYAVNARYAPASKADLDFLREPHLESLGVNFDTVIRGVFDLLQQDFATDWNITAPIEGDLIEIDDKTTSVRLKLTAEMEESAAMAFDAEFGYEEGFTISADGSVTFDTAGLAAMAEKIAETLKVEQAAMVGALLSLFTIKASVGVDHKSTISGATKVQIHFKPAILKRFVLTKID